MGNNSWSSYFLSLNKLKQSLELGLKSPKRPFCKPPLEVSTAANTSGAIACSYSRNNCSLQPSGTRNRWALGGRQSAEPAGMAEMLGKAGHRHLLVPASSPAPTASTHLGLPARTPAGSLPLLPQQASLPRVISSQIITEEVLMQGAVRGDSLDAGRIIPIYLL